MSVSFRPLLTPDMIAEEVIGEETEEEEEGGARLRDSQIIQISGFTYRLLIQLSSLGFKILSG